MFVKSVIHVYGLHLDTFKDNIDCDDKTWRAFIFYKHAKTTFIYMVEFWYMIDIMVTWHIFPFILLYTKGEKVWGFVWNIDKTGLNINKHSLLDATQWLAISGLYC